MPAHIEILRWIVAVLVSLVLLIASLRDINERRIPNWTVAAIVILFGAWAFAMPSVSLLSSLEAALIVFGVTAALFAFGLLGAGDSKLMTVLALFAGLGRLPLFGMATVLSGGGLALFSLALRLGRVFVTLPMRKQGHVERDVPYGVAISFAGILVMFTELSCGSIGSRFVCF